MAAVHTTIFLKNKIKTKQTLLYQHLLYFDVDAKCFGPYIGPSSGAQKTRALLQNISTLYNFNVNF
jgi:hypothetical protein